MKLTVLTDNCAGKQFLAEHGLSYLVESKDKRILFDAGHTDVFLKNAQSMGIDLSATIDTIVLSHGHWDHGNGLRHFEGHPLITHPQSFIKRYRKGEDHNIGLDLSKQEIERRFKLSTSSKPYHISENILFLGEIPRKNDFEAQTSPFVDENDCPDFVPDDSALAIVEGQDLHIVSGCSHAGICNIITHAISVTGTARVRSVIGGYHLKYNNRQTRQTIRFLKKNKITRVFPAHCTELEAMVAFAGEFDIAQVKTGSILRF